MDRMSKNEKDQNRQQARQYSTLSSSLATDQMQTSEREGDNTGVNTTTVTGDVDLQSEQFGVNELNQEMYFDDPKYWDDNMMFTDAFDEMGLQDKEKKAFNTTSYKEEWGHLPHAVEDDDRYERMTSTLSNRGASTSSMPRWDQNSNFDQQSQIRNNVAMPENRELPKNVNPLLSQFPNGSQIQNPNVKKAISKRQTMTPMPTAAHREPIRGGQGSHAMGMNPYAMMPNGGVGVTLPGVNGINGAGMMTAPVGNMSLMNVPGVNGGMALSNDPRFGVPVAEGTLVVKREKQMIRNRISAQKSRDKKKNYMQDLESHIKDRDHEVSKLRHKIDNLEKTNRELDEMVRRYTTTSQNSLFGLPMNGPSIFDDGNPLTNAIPSTLLNAAAAGGVQGGNVASNLVAENGHNASANLANLANGANNTVGTSGTGAGGGVAGSNGALAGANPAMLQNLGANNSNAAAFGVIAVLTAMAMNNFGPGQRQVQPNLTGQLGNSTTTATTGVQNSATPNTTTTMNHEGAASLFSQGVFTHRQPSEDAGSHGRQSSGGASDGNGMAREASALLTNHENAGMEAGLLDPVSTIADFAPSEDCMSTSSHLAAANSVNKDVDEGGQSTDIRNFANGKQV